jgi:hypothetical protein|tara:strand:- start:472 stop:657 length:186 start_codon:yes stop_codon:yes gene_type:complete
MEWSDIFRLSFIALLLFAIGCVSKKKETNSIDNWLPPVEVDLPDDDEMDDLPEAGDDESED